MEHTTPGIVTTRLLVGIVVIACAACAGDREHPAGFVAVTVDTLPNGTIVVDNPDYGIWDSTEAWRVEEEMRIGALEGTGPELFGRISAIEVDELGRLYVLESQAQELRVFDASGSHVRNIGRQGGGPGEFEQAIGLAWAPDGNLWVVDPGNVRISVFDTTGTYLTMKRILGGYVMMPWPGRFDRAGLFYHYGLDISDERGARFVMVRFDTLMQPLDTIRVPRIPQNHYFELKSADGTVTAGIPFTASVTYRIGPAGHLWFANTDDYRIYKRRVDGDTALIIARDFEPMPVSDEEVDSAIARLEWFTRQGGRVDRSRFPDLKPALNTLYIDDEDNLWVVPVGTSEESWRILDVFDSSGRYLGRIRLPFRLGGGPIPIIRGGFLFCVTTDEFNVPYVVRARIVKP